MRHFTEGRMRLQMVALAIATLFLVISSLDGKPDFLAVVCMITAIISWAAKRVSLAQDHQERLDQ